MWDLISSNIVFEIQGIEIGIEEIRLDGTVRLQLRPLLEHLPTIGKLVSIFQSFEILRVLVFNYTTTHIYTMYILNLVIYIYIAVLPRAFQLVRP